LKLNGTHQILVYAGDVNILGRNLHTVTENAEALLVASRRLEKKQMLISMWSCLEIRMQDEVAV